MVSGTHFAAHKKISARIGPEFFPPTRAKQSDGTYWLLAVPDTGRFSMPEKMTELARGGSGMINKPGSGP